MVEVLFLTIAFIASLPSAEYVYAETMETVCSSQGMYAVPNPPLCNCSGQEPLLVLLGIVTPDEVEFTGNCENGWCKQVFHQEEEWQDFTWYVQIPIGKCLDRFDFQFAGPPAATPCTSGNQCPAGRYSISGIQSGVPTFVDCEEPPGGGS